MVESTVSLIYSPPKNKCTIYSFKQNCSLFDISAVKITGAPDEENVVVEEEENLP